MRNAIPGIENIDITPEQYSKTIKTVLITCSCGGHLVQALKISEAFHDFEVLFVINDATSLSANMVGRTLYITRAARSLKQLVNILEAYRILKAFRPKVILSTGSAPAVTFGLVGKYLFGCKIIFVESFSRVTMPSLAARLMYPIADHFYIQWESLRPHFPKAKFAGSLL